MGSGEYRSQHALGEAEVGSGEDRSQHALGEAE